MKKILMLFVFLYSFQAYALEETPSENVVEENAPVQEVVSAETAKEATAEEKTGVLESLKKQLKKFMSLFEQEKQKQQQEKENPSKPQEAVPENQEKTETEPESVVKEENKAQELVAKKITPSMAFSVFSFRENKKLSRVTNEELQEVIQAIKLHPLHENAAPAVNSRNAIRITSYMGFENGEKTRLQIERNLALYVAAYDVLNNRVPENASKEDRELPPLFWNGMSFPTGSFRTVEIKGYKTYVASKGEFTSVVMILSPYLMLRLETEGPDHAQRAMSFFDHIDLTAVKKAMKVENETQSIEEIRKKFDEELKTPEGRKFILDYLGKGYEF